MASPPPKPSFAVNITDSEVESIAASIADEDWKTVYLLHDRLKEEARLQHPGGGARSKRTPANPAPPEGTPPQPRARGAQHKVPAGCDFSVLTKGSASRWKLLCPQIRNDELCNIVKPPKEEPKLKTVAKKILRGRRHLGKVLPKLQGEGQPANNTSKGRTFGKASKWALPCASTTPSSRKAVTSAALDLPHFASHSSASQWRVFTRDVLRNAKAFAGDSQFRTRQQKPPKNGTAELKPHLLRSPMVVEEVQLGGVDSASSSPQFVQSRYDITPLEAMLGRSRAASQTTPGNIRAQQARTNSAKLWISRFEKAGLIETTDLACSTHPTPHALGYPRQCCISAGIHDALMKTYYDMERTATWGLWGDPLGRSSISEGIFEKAQAGFCEVVGFEVEERLILQLSFVYEMSEESPARPPQQRTKIPESRRKRETISLAEHSHSGNAFSNNVLTLEWTSRAAKQLQHKVDIVPPQPFLQELNFGHHFFSNKFVGGLSDPFGSSFGGQQSKARLSAGTLLKLMESCEEYTRKACIGWCEAVCFEDIAQKYALCNRLAGFMATDRTHRISCEGIVCTYTWHASEVLQTKILNALSATRDPQHHSPIAVMNAKEVLLLALPFLNAISGFLEILPKFRQVGGLEAEWSRLFTTLPRFSSGHSRGVHDTNEHIEELRLDISRRTSKEKEAVPEVSLSRHASNVSFASDDGTLSPPPPPPPPKKPTPEVSVGPEDKKEEPVVWYRLCGEESVQLRTVFEDAQQRSAIELFHNLKLEKEKQNVALLKQSIEEESESILCESIHPPGGLAPNASKPRFSTAVARQSINIPQFSTTQGLFGGFTDDLSRCTNNITLSSPFETRQSLSPMVRPPPPRSARGSALVSTPGSAERTPERRLSAVEYVATTSQLLEANFSKKPAKQTRYLPGVNSQCATFPFAPTLTRSKRTLKRHMRCGDSVMVLLDSGATSSVRDISFLLPHDNAEEGMVFPFLGVPFEVCSQAPPSLLRVFPNDILVLREAMETADVSQSHKESNGPGWKLTFIDDDMPEVRGQKEAKCIHPECTISLELQTIQARCINAVRDAMRLWRSLDLLDFGGKCLVYKKSWCGSDLSRIGASIFYAHRLQVDMKRQSQLLFCTEGSNPSTTTTPAPTSKSYDTIFPKDTYETVEEPHVEDVVSLSRPYIISTESPLVLKDLLFSLNEALPECNVVVADITDENAFSERLALKQTLDVIRGNTRFDPLVYSLTDYSNDAICNKAQVVFADIHSSTTGGRVEKEVKPVSLMPQTPRSGCTPPGSTLFQTRAKQRAFSVTDSDPQMNLHLGGSPPNLPENDENEERLRNFDSDEESSFTSSLFHPPSRMPSPRYKQKCGHHTFTDNDLFEATAPPAAVPVLRWSKGQNVIEESVLKEADVIVVNLLGMSVEGLKKLAGVGATMIRGQRGRRRAYLELRASFAVLGRQIADIINKIPVPLPLLSLRTTEKDIRCNIALQESILWNFISSNSRFFVDRVALKGVSGELAARHIPASLYSICGNLKRVHSSVDLLLKVRQYQEAKLNRVVSSTISVETQEHNIIEALSAVQMMEALRRGAFLEGREAQKRACLAESFYRFPANTQRRDPAVQPTPEAASLVVQRRTGLLHCSQASRLSFEEALSRGKIWHDSIAGWIHHAGGICIPPEGKTPGVGEVEGVGCVIPLFHVFSFLAEMFEYVRSIQGLPMKAAEGMRGFDMNLMETRQRKERATTSATHLLNYWGFPRERTIVLVDPLVFSEQNGAAAVPADIVGDNHHFIPAVASVVPPEMLRNADRDSLWDVLQKVVTERLQETRHTLLSRRFLPKSLETEGLLVYAETAASVVFAKGEEKTRILLDWFSEPLLWGLGQRAVVMEEADVRGALVELVERFFEELVLVVERAEREVGGGGGGREVPTTAKTRRRGSAYEIPSQSRHHHHHSPRKALFGRSDLKITLLCTEEHLQRNYITALAHSGFVTTLLPLTLRNAAPFSTPHSLFPIQYIKDYLLARSLLLLPDPHRGCVLWERSPFEVPDVIKFIVLYMEKQGHDVRSTNKLFENICISGEGPIDVLCNTMRQGKPAWESDVFSAAERGDVATLRVLMYLGLNARKNANSSRGPMHRAASQGHPLSLQILSLMAGDPNESDCQGVSAIHTAAKGGWVECVRTLLQLGVHPDSEDIHGRTPLHYALANGHIPCRDVLLQHNACPLRCDHFGLLPTDAAAYDPCAVPQSMLSYPALPTPSVLQPPEGSAYTEMSPSSPVQRVLSPLKLR